MVATNLRLILKLVNNNWRNKTKTQRHLVYAINEVAEDNDDDINSAICRAIAIFESSSPHIHPFISIDKWASYPKRQKIEVLKVLELAITLEIGAPEIGMYRNKVA